MAAQRRVVITGVGVISAIGCGARDFWQACLRGNTSVERVPEHWHRLATLTSNIWSPLADLDARLEGVTARELERIDRVTAMAVSTSMQSLRHAGFEVQAVDSRRLGYRAHGLAAGRTGVFMGTGVGGASSFAAAHANHLLKEPLSQLNAAPRRALAGHDIGAVSALSFPKRFNPLSVSMLMPNAVSAYTGIKFGLTGENSTVTLACASGTAAIGRAFEAIRDQRLDCALAGGAEYLHDEHGSVFRGFDACRTLVRQTQLPENANRPFDAERSGFLFSEGGAATLVLESLEAARGRGATPIAEIVGFSEGFDAYGMVSPSPDGSGMRAMLDSLLESADVAADAIDYVNAHGNGTINSDAVEAQVLAQTFAERPVVNSTKSLLGHTMGASGALEAVVTALSLEQQRVHACANLKQPIADLDFATRARHVQMEHAITQSAAFGGHNAGLLMKRLN